MKLWRWTWIVALAVCVSGCGTAEYESRLEATAGALMRAETEARTKAQRAQLYAGFYGAGDIPGTTIKIRVPKAFNESFNDLPLEGFTIPDLRVAYRGKAEDGTGPWTLHIFSSPVPNPGDDRKLADLLKQQVAAAVKGSTPEWQEQKCPIPEGGEMPWQVIEAKGEQTLEGSAQAADVRVYMHVANGQAVVLVWDMAEGFVNVSNVDQLAPLVAGSVEFAAAQPAA